MVGVSVSASLAVAIPIPITTVFPAVTLLSKAILNGEAEFTYPPELVALLWTLVMDEIGKVVVEVDNEVDDELLVELVEALVEVVVEVELDVELVEVVVPPLSLPTVSSNQLSIYSNEPSNHPSIV